MFWKKPVLDLRGKLGNAPMLYTYGQVASRLASELRHGADAIAVCKLKQWDMSEQLGRGI